MFTNNLCKLSLVHSRLNVLVCTHPLLSVYVVLVCLCAPPLCSPKLSFILDLHLCDWLMIWPNDVSAHTKRPNHSVSAHMHSTRTWNQFLSSM
ncbi:hypothetical protein HanRHA438_Chr02g0095641 [Helianthus annuus]|nr:hypothetical protein HanRHA438_Chr02g0095641 [Helianthus annuus]